MIDWSVVDRSINQSRAIDWSLSLQSIVFMKKHHRHSPLDTDSIQRDGQAAGLQGSDENWIHKKEIMYLRTGSSALT